MSASFVVATPVVDRDAGSGAYSCDVVIAGGGPAGLSLAAALSQVGFSSVVVEPQSRQQLAAPAPDGREIALTHPSVAMLQQLGSWQRLAVHECGRIVDAVVHDGPVGMRPTLDIRSAGSGVDFLGRIAPNHALRRTAWEAASSSVGAHIIDRARVTQLDIGHEWARVQYSQEGTDAPQWLQAKLVVAADSRLSSVRRMLGVGARMLDFGRTVIVCRLHHEHAHADVAHECFGYERTLAILPLPDDPATGEHVCSAVVTTDALDGQRLMALDDAAFAQQIQAYFQHRLGAMRLVGQRHAYPLVATYAHRFAGHRFALIGDAAVGMHPVTAHGYNLGLAGVQGLSAALSAARNVGADIGAHTSLKAFARAHHRHAWPIFEGTNAIVKLFTDARAPAQLLRRVVMEGSRRLPPLQTAIVAQLTGRSALEMLGLPRLPQLPTLPQGIPTSAAAVKAALGRVAAAAPWRR